MRGLFRYKHLTIIAIFLVLLLFFAVLLSSFFSRTGSTGTVAPILTPAQFSNRPGGFEGKPAPTLSDDEIGNTRKGRVFSADQLDRLKKFDKEIPYYSQDFDIGYSKLLDQYFVQLKSDDANEKFEQFLREQGMLDIRNVYRDMFVVGTDTVYNQIKNAEKKYLETQ